MSWYLVDTGYACGGVEIIDGVVNNTAPIFAWMRGKRWERVKRWKKIKRIQESP